MLCSNMYSRMENAFFLTVIKAVLVIFTIHFVLKRYLLAQALSLPAFAATSTIGAAVPLQVSSTPRNSTGIPQIVRDVDSSEISEEDIKNQLRDFANTFDKDDDAHPNAISVPGEVQGLKFYSQYRPAGMHDRGVDVTGQVKLPQRNDVTRLDELRMYDTSAPDEDIMDEGVMNGGDLMEGVHGIDAYDDEFFEI